MQLKIKQLSGMWVVVDWHDENVTDRLFGTHEEAYDWMMAKYHKARVPVCTDEFLRVEVGLIYEIDRSLPDQYTVEYRVYIVDNKGRWDEGFWPDDTTYEGLLAARVAASELYDEVCLNTEAERTWMVIALNTEQADPFEYVFLQHTADGVRSVWRMIVRDFGIEDLDMAYPQSIAAHPFYIKVQEIIHDKERR